MFALDQSFTSGRRLPALKQATLLDPSRPVVASFHPQSSACLVSCKVQCNIAAFTELILDGFVSRHADDVRASLKCHSQGLLALGV